MPYSLLFIVASLEEGKAFLHKSSGRRPALLLVHGGGSTPERWQPIVPAFEGVFTVHRMARRGERSQPAHAARLASIHILVHTVGQFMAVATNLRRKNHDPISFVSQLPANEKQTMLEAIGAEAVRARAIELQRMDPAILDPAIDGVLLAGCEPDDLLAQIRCPIHLLAAQIALGGAMDAQDVERFAVHAPHATYAVLEGVGHGIHEERPAEYVQALRQFMAAVSVQGMRA